MDKLDKSIIESMRAQAKFDDGICGVLQTCDCASALVRVRSPLHLSLLERKFDVTNVYPFIRSVGIRCRLKDAILLERMQEVEYVSAQSKVFALDGGENYSISGKKSGDEGEDDRATSLGGEDGGRKKFGGIFGGVEALSRPLDGRGVTMCVLDTGVAPHSDLSVPRERIAHFVDMIGDGDEPYDDNGHGTFVAGVACGNGLLSAGNIAGVAPAANIVGIKVIASDGTSGTFKILDGMQWLFDNFRQYGIRVVCMSFGAEPLNYADPLKLGADMLARSGLIVVAAAGNSGKDGLKSPAISDEIISVGAVNGNDEIASFSSRGTYRGVARPDLYADGVDVKGISVGATYSYMSGTSAAAPYVAGACCLLCQMHKNITPFEAKRMLLNYSRDVNGIKVLRLK